MSERNIGPTSQDDDISIREILIKLGDWIRYFLRKWQLILVCVVLGALSGLLYASFKKVDYIAKLNFVMEETAGSQSSALGAASGIAAQLGINLGGLANSSGLFQGDHIIEFLKSRRMINETLLTRTDLGTGSAELLVDRYVTLYNLRKKWEGKPFENIKFVDTMGVYLQDSLMREIYDSIIKRNLEIEKPDKKLNIIEISMTSPDQYFSKAFVEILVANATDFYVKTTTKKSQDNLDVLTHQVDSVRGELNAAIGGVAAATDANPNANRAFQSLRVGSQLRTVDVQANTAILGELVKNQELAKMSLRNEKPLIQVLDQPILPLKNDRVGKLKGIVIGGFLGGFLIVLLLLLRRTYHQIMNNG